ncbi:hypothetical protein R5R35_009937 [Gryllus longicercus]|uniref:Uncharacterized protein n=1 Tax=Gryllus longicercus TaxID=2509291 RepID=A0AAN9YY19_9ORTH
MNMESENTPDDLIQKRNRLMNEVVSLRRKVPKTLVALEEKIQKKKLKELVTREYRPDAIQDQLNRYLAEKSACEGRRVPNWINDLKSVKATIAKVEEANTLLQEREKNSIDFNILMKKSLEVQERLHHFEVAQKQLANENPLITRARLEGYNHMIHLKANQEENDHLDTEVEQS